MKLFVAYLIIINIAAFVIMGVDKLRAANHRWRIRESTLMIFALAGGSVGAIAAMLLLRHKTRHREFTIGLPTILVIQLVLYFCIKKFCG